jgi:hypothetical protein
MRVECVSRFSVIRRSRLPNACHRTSGQPALLPHRADSYTLPHGHLCDLCAALALCMTFAAMSYAGRDFELGGRLGVNSVALQALSNPQSTDSCPTNRLRRLRRLSTHLVHRNFLAGRQVPLIGVAYFQSAVTSAPKSHAPDGFQGGGRSRGDGRS